MCTPIFTLREKKWRLLHTYTVWNNIIPTHELQLCLVGGALQDISRVTAQVDSVTHIEVLVRIQVCIPGGWHRAGDTWRKEGTIFQYGHNFFTAKKSYKILHNVSKDVPDGFEWHLARQGKACQIGATVIFIFGRDPPCLLSFNTPKIFQWQNSCKIPICQPATVRLYAGCLDNMEVLLLEVC